MSQPIIESSEALLNHWFSNGLQVPSDAWMEISKESDNVKTVITQTMRQWYRNSTPPAKMIDDVLATIQALATACIDEKSIRMDEIDIRLKATLPSEMVEKDANRCKKCAKRSIAILAHIFKKEAHEYNAVDAYIAFEGYLDNILTDTEKRDLAIRLKHMPRVVLESILKKIDSMEIVTCRTDKKAIKMACLNLLTIETFTADILHRTLNFVSDLVSSDKICLHLFKGEGVLCFLERMVTCIQNNRMAVHMISCPDYSGSIIEGVWNYDFASLGTGAGFVGRRAVGFVTNFATIAKKYISVVEVHHLLPTYEFLKPEEKFGDYKGKLAASLEAIRTLYGSLDVKMHLSSEWLPDEEFTTEKAALLMTGINEDFAKIILTARTPIYKKWYPDDSDEDLLLRAKSQIADYLIVGRLMTKEDPQSILLASDSTIMCQTYLQDKIPFLFGMARGAMRYMGD